MNQAGPAGKRDVVSLLLSAGPIAKINPIATIGKFAKKARTPRSRRTVQPDHSADSAAYLKIQDCISPSGGMSSGIRGD